MAKDKGKTNVLTQLTGAGNDAIGIVNRLDEATGKFQSGRRQGSIVKAAQGNVFEFPVFISNNVPLDYATATSSLLEQIYAAYLQMAISINPVVDADSVKNNMQFAGLKTDTNKYLEYTDMSYAHDVCHAVYQEGMYQTEFSLLSIEDKDARLINEAVDHQPLSEFDHFFVEASYVGRNILYPLPDIKTGVDGKNHVEIFTDPKDKNKPAEEQTKINYINPNNTRWMTADEMKSVLGKGGYELDDSEIYDCINRMTDTMKYYGFKEVTLQSVTDSEMSYIKNTVSNLTPDQLGANSDLMDRIANIDLRYPGFRDAMYKIADNNKQASRVSKTIEAINTGASTVGSVAKAVDNVANTAKNVMTLPDQIRATRAAAEKAKYDTQTSKWNADHLEETRRRQQNDVNAKIATKAPQYVRDSDCQKLNTMKPLLMQVQMSMINKDDTIQPINYIIGVKTHSRVIPASVLPEVAKYPLKEMDKISRKIKWRAGELKFFKDIVFRISEKKQTAADARDPKRKWYRRLYELAHMKGDAPAAAVVQGKSIFASFIRDKQGKSKMMNGVIPNVTIVMSQADVDNIKNSTEIDLLKGSVAKNFCGELFLMSLVIIDTDAESIKIMLPDMNDDYDVHSLASVNKQLATLDTAGTKTRDMFKMLG